MKNVLTQIGLHEYEQRIYMALLDMGSARISDIVSHVALHRPTVYKHIKKLQEYHLVVTTCIGKRIYYSAASPDILNIMVNKIQERVHNVLPELHDKYEAVSGKPTMQWFQGERVITWVYEDVLATCKKGDVLYRYESPKDFTAIDEYLPPEYFERVCRKKEIDKFVITNEKTAKTKKQVLERVTKYVPVDFDIFDYDITEIIYADKVAFLDITHRTAWIVEASSFAHFQKRLFQLLFQKL